MQVGEESKEDVIGMEAFVLESQICGNFNVIHFMQQMCILVQHKICRRIFDMCDVDGNGTLSFRVILLSTTIFILTSNDLTLTKNISPTINFYLI